MPVARCVSQGGPMGMSARVSARVQVSSLDISSLSQVING